MDDIPHPIMYAQCMQNCTPLHGLGAKAQGDGRKKCIAHCPLIKIPLTSHGVDADPVGVLHPEAARDVDVYGDGDGAAEHVANSPGGRPRIQVSVVHHLPRVQQLRGLSGMSG